MESRTNQIKKKIDEAIGKAKIKNNYKGVWNGIVKENYGVDCNVDDARKAFTKECGYTPHQYYRSKVYDIILRRIIKQEIAYPKNEDQEIDGIMNCMRKVKRFYNKQNIKEVISMKKKQMAQEERIALGEDLIESLDNCPAIADYIVEDDHIRLTLDEGGFVYMMFGLYPPIIVNSSIKKQINKTKNINARCMLLLIATHTDLNSEKLKNGVKFTMQEEEVAELFDIFRTYKFDSPSKRGGMYVYTHDMTENENAILKSEIARNFDIYVNKLTLVCPESEETQSLELYKFLSSGRIITLKSVIEETQKCKEYIIDQVVNMIANGFLWMPL